MMINVVLASLSAKTITKTVRYKRNHSPHDRLWNRNRGQTCLFEQRKLAAKQVIETTNIMVIEADQYMCCSSFSSHPPAALVIFKEHDR
jgi:hypothetical protein